jgi:DNA-binding NarL/FixJ family response regulator
MKRVFVLTSRSLFGEGVERLLRQETALNIVGQESDVGRAITCIQRTQPNTVIFDSHDLSDNPLRSIIEVLRTNPHIKFIGLDLQQNTFQIYQAIRREVNTISDLLEAI